LVDGKLGCFKRFFFQYIGRNADAFYAGFFFDFGSQFDGSFFVSIYYGGVDTGSGQASCQ
jgi:hypothetical protein